MMRHPEIDAQNDVARDGGVVERQRATRVAHAPALCRRTYRGALTRGGIARDGAIHDGDGVRGVKPSAGPHSAAEAASVVLSDQAVRDENGAAARCDPTAAAARVVVADGAAVYPEIRVITTTRIAVYPAEPIIRGIARDSAVGKEKVAALMRDTAATSTMLPVTVLFVRR